MARLRFDWEGVSREVLFQPPARLSDVLRQAGAAPDMPCGGRGVCLKCKARVTGALTPPDPREAALLTARDRAEGARFLCMTVARGDCAIVSPLGEGVEAVNTDTAREARPLDPWGERLGLAVDLGTTTVAAALYSLRDGGRLAARGERNPQRAFGADVMSRMDAALSGHSAALAEAARGCVASLLAALLAEAHASPDDVDSAVVTGNTAMLYLLCGRDPRSIALAPFRQDCSFGAFEDAALAGLPASTRVFVPRCVSAYVGADTNTALLAASFFSRGRVTGGAPRLLADIGTNGEIVLAADGALLCCSAAAGPAFEGAGISQGMPARAGAIHHVTLRGGAPACETLGGGEATGLCGSGLLDAVAALLSLGILDETGALNAPGRAYTLPGTRVTLTQRDIRAVQLAKAAMRAGMEVLLREAGLQARDVAELVIAGGFGSRMSGASAEAVGLIPKGLGARVRYIGNGALSGAAMALLSREALEDTRRLPDAARTLELSTHPAFMDAYVDAMLF